MICGSLRTYIGSTPSFRCMLFILIVSYYGSRLISNIGLFYKVDVRAGIPSIMTIIFELGVWMFQLSVTFSMWSSCSSFFDRFSLYGGQHNERLSTIFLPVTWLNFFKERDLNFSNSINSVFNVTESRIQRQWPSPPFPTCLHEESTVKTLVMRITVSSNSSWYFACLGFHLNFYFCRSDHVPHSKFDSWFSFRNLQDYGIRTIFLNLSIFLLTFTSTSIIHFHGNHSLNCNHLPAKELPICYYLFNLSNFTSLVPSSFSCKN